MNVRQPIAFHCAFENAQEVYELIRRREEERDRYSVDRDCVFRKGKKLYNGNAGIRSNLRFIYRWKLRSFERRFKWVSDFPDGVSDIVLNKAVQAARKAINNPSDEELARSAIVAFDKMKYVGVPVASAFLTAMDPTQFTIIDRQAFKALGTPFRARPSCRIACLDGQPNACYCR